MNDTPYELRVGRGVAADVLEHASRIAADIHGQVELESVRIYYNTPRTYRLSILIKGRRTLAAMDIRMAGRTNTRASAFVEWVTSSDVVAEMDAADALREVPLLVERVLPVMLHEYGDGRYFHTMMINATRRRDIMFPSRQTKPWDEAQISNGVTLGTGGKHRPVVRCHKQDFSIDVTRLRLKNAPAKIDVSTASGRPLDQVLDHQGIRGCGLVVARWVKETGTPGSDHYLIDLKSDLMPVAEAAALVDELRLRRDRRGVGSLRTPARRHVEGYVPSPEAIPEDPMIMFYDDVNEHDVLLSLVVEPIMTRMDLDPIAAALLSEHGLVDAYNERLASERDAIAKESENAFCMQFVQYGTKGDHDVLTYNMTPWLREASEEEIGKVIHAMFGRTMRTDEVLLKMAARCRRHVNGEPGADMNHLAVFMTPNRHDERRFLEVIDLLRPDVASAAHRIMRFAKTSRELEFDRMWAEMQCIDKAA